MGEVEANAQVQLGQYCTFSNVSSSPVPAAGEPHPRDALAASLRVVVEVDFLARSNSLVKELLYATINIDSFSPTLCKGILTLI